MSTQKRQNKALIIADDEEGEELNPFSFREFIRSKNQNQNPDLDPDLEQSDLLTAAKENFRPLVSHSENTHSSLWLPEEEGEEEEEEEEDEEVKTSRFSSRAAVSTTEVTEGENYEGDDETSMSVPPISYRDSRSSQLQKLKEENISLRRKIKELQKKSDTSEQRVLQLSKELLQRRREEEKEAQELESMVLSVEQNLHLMTKRAVKAENNVTILRLELQHLQGQAEAYRSEVEQMKAAEMEVVKTMRQNAQLASKYLNQAANQAQSSIKQLLGGAETLCLVSQMLQSIDKISDLHTEL